MAKEFFDEINFRAKSRIMIMQANEIIEDYQADGLTLTLRQLYYQFVSRGLLPNTQRSYDNLGRTISNARIAGLVDWDAIEDRTRFLRGRNNWNTPAGMIRVNASRYTIDMWEGQEKCVEVWIEKDALIGVIETLNGFLASQGFLIQFSDIFAAMVFGYLVRKRISQDKEKVPELLERVMAPVVMIFFVMVGGRMAQLLTTSETLLLIALTAALYLGGRTIAKYFGASIGGRIVNEVPAIQKYLGGCLLCQAGVALGLSFVIEETFVALGGDAQIMGVLILGVVAVSTMILEMIGPMAVKMSLRAAGELPEDHIIFEPHEVTLTDITEGKNSPITLDDVDLDTNTKDESSPTS